MLSALMCILFGCALTSTNAIFYRCYDKSTDQYTDSPSGDPAAFMKKINTSLGTTFFVHGWRENCGNKSAVTTTSALLSRGNSNVCCLDWSEYTKLDYASAASKTQDVAKNFSNDIIGFYGLGLRVGDPYIIGFSLGAHVAGFTGRNLNASKPSYKLGRITGLDPAGPLFEGILLNPGHLQSTDAKFVDCLHTDSGVFGISSPYCTCDTYVNNGTRIQPGCPIIPNTLDLNGILADYRCSHDRSYIYYAEAIQFVNTQIAVRCGSLISFGANSCSNNEKISVGLENNSTCKGVYRYKTRSSSPFGQGDAGTRP